MFNKLKEKIDELVDAWIITKSSSDYHKKICENLICMVVTWKTITKLAQERDVMARIHPSEYLYQQEIIEVYEVEEILIELLVAWFSYKYIKEILFYKKDLKC